MTHFFEKRDLWGNRLSLWVVVLMAFLSPICWWSVRQLYVESNLEEWLPPNDTDRRSLQWTHEQFPFEERILLTWDGSSINDARAGKLKEQLVGKPDTHGIKRGGLPYFSSVVDPVHVLKVMQQNGIEPQEAAKRLEGTILGAGPLRLELTEIGRSALKKTKRELQSAFRSRFGGDLVIQDPTLDLAPLISIPVPDDSPGTSDEPTAPAILTPNGQLAERSTIDHDFQVSWKGMRVGVERTIEIAEWFTEYIPEKGDRQPLVDRCFFAIGSPIAIAVGISDAGLADKAETVAAIRAACKTAAIPEESLHLTGNVISASDLNQEVINAAWDTSVPLLQIHRRSVLLTSLLVSALFTCLMLRNVRLAAIIVIISLITAFYAIALVPITGGSINFLLIVMPTLLVVLTMSCAVHFAGYRNHECNSDETKAIVETVRRARIPCLLASLAGAIGPISLCTSRITPVAEFGFYATGGMLISLMGLSYGLPSLMQFWPELSPPKHELEHSAWRSFGELLTLRSAWKSLVVAGICAGLSLGVFRFRIGTVRDLSEQSRIARDNSFFELNLGGVMPVENIIRFDEQSQKDTNFLDRMELIRQIQTKMRTHAVVSGSVSLADFNPVSEQPPEEAGFLLKTKYNKKATIIHQRIRDGELEFAPSYYSVSDPMLDRHESSVQQMNQPGDELWKISAQVKLTSNQDFSKVLDDLHHITQDVLKLQPGSRHLITGSVPMFVRTQQAIMQSLIGSSALALALALLVFLIHFRSFGAALVSIIPTIAPVMVVLGTFSWMNQQFDVSSMMTAPIGIGIAAIGTLHFLSWVQIGMKKGHPRRQTIVEAMVNGGPQLWQSSVIIASSLSMLIPAELRVISRFGLLMAAMTTVALITNTVLLPLLMAGPLGWFFEPGTPSGVASVTLNEPKECPHELADTTTLDDGKGPPPPHIKPIDPSRKNRRPTA